MTLLDLENILQEEKALQFLESKAREKQAALYDPQAPRIDAEKIRTTDRTHGAKIDRVIDSLNELQERRAALEAKKEKAGRILCRLDDDGRTIMTLHYINGIPWPEVAAILTISPATIYRKRAEAVKMLTKRP